MGFFSKFENRMEDTFEGAADKMSKAPITPVQITKKAEKQMRRETMVGAPYVAGACVEAEVVENGKADKVIIFKYKAKKDYRKKQGHRQPYTELKINGISVNGEMKSKAAEAPKAEAAAEETVDLNSMKKAELAEFAAAKGIEVDSKLKKEEMIAAIEAALAK